MPELEVLDERERDAGRLDRVNLKKLRSRKESATEPLTERSTHHVTESGTRKHIPSDQLDQNIDADLKWDGMSAGIRQYVGRY